MAITQLAVFEAVNAITGDYKPYLGTVVAPAGASADAAAVAAAYTVLKNYFPLAPNLDAAYAASLAAIPDGSAKSGGIATGQAAAAQMIALRLNDGSSPPQFYAARVDRPRRVAAHAKLPRRRRRRFSVAGHHTVRCAERSRQPGVDRAVCPGSAPGAHQQAIRKGLQRVEEGRQREQRSHRAAAGSGRCGAVLRGVLAEPSCSTWPRGRSRPRRAARFRRMREPSRCSIWPATTASSRRSGRSITTSSGGPRRRFSRATWMATREPTPTSTYVPYILTPCFPSYPSNHGSASNSAAEILRRVYGEGGHAITMANPAVPGLTFHYTRFNQITDDISDARIFGGIHFRFDQEAGADLGRDIGTYVYRHNLRRAKHSDTTTKATTMTSTTAARTIVTRNAAAAGRAEGDLPTPMESSEHTLRQDGEPAHRNSTHDAIAIRDGEGTREEEEGEVAAERPLPLDDDSASRFR